MQAAIIRSQARGVSVTSVVEFCEGELPGNKFLLKLMEARVCL